MNRKQFAADLAHEPDHTVRAWGRNIMANMKVIENPRTGEKDRAAAQVQLEKNRAQFERLRDAS